MCSEDDVSNFYYHVDVAVTGLSISLSCLKNDDDDDDNCDVYRHDHMLDASFDFPVPLP